MKLFLTTVIIALSLIILPNWAKAAGISAGGGTTKAVGQYFTVSVTASGTTFDSLQGSISVSGPASVVAVSAGNATWLPGKTPSGNGQFVGLTSATHSLLVAKLTLKGTKIGSGSVSVSGVKLAYKGAIVGSGGGSTSFTITRALVMPGTPKVTSSTHPDQNAAYEATTVALAWNKDPGVTGFATAFDHAAATVPAQKVTTAATSASYPDLAVGTYYFHIRAQNGDGWSDTTHFKITIKEPDAKIDSTLTKPTIDKITRTDAFATNVADGTVTGIQLTGKSLAGYTINLTFDPSVTPPEGKSLSTTVDDQGNWQYMVDYPIHAGFYKVTVQGQKDKTLTPVSDELRFEATLAKGGDIRLITDADVAKAAAPAPAPSPSPTPKSGVNNQYVLYGGGAGIGLFVIISLVMWLKKQSHA